MKHKTRVKNYNKIVVSFKYLQSDQLVRGCACVLEYCWPHYHLEYSQVVMNIMVIMVIYMKMSKVKRMCVLVGMLLLWEG